jgi:hypothetical protein
MDSTMISIYYAFKSDPDHLLLLQQIPNENTEQIGPDSYFWNDQYRL